MTYLEAQSQLFTLSEKLLQCFAGSQFADELTVAKQQFFEGAGILDEKSENYDHRMNQFFDWYLFTRELSGFGQTPLDAVGSVRELRLSPQEEHLLAALKGHVHGLFEFLKFKGDDVILKDLLRNEKVTIKECPWRHGFDSEEVFETRIIPIDDRWVFAKSFCFHPGDAKKYILGEIKKHRKDPDLDPDQMMLKLCKMRYRFERYRHVSVNVIYSDDSPQMG